MSKRFRLVSLLLIAVLFGLTFGAAQFRADAGPSASGPQYRIAAIEGGSIARSIPLIEQRVHTMPNTTPVAGQTFCIDGDPDLFAARLTLTGTMAGTNPVVTNVLQSSDDGGTTWTAVGSSFAAINATVTPAAGKERVTFADSASGGINTPVAYGNCFRVLTTWAGTGTVTANFGVNLYAE